MMRAWKVAGSVAVAGVLAVLAVIVPIRSTLALEPEQPAAAGKASVDGTNVERLDFWPKRVNPETSHLLYVQLAHRSSSPKVHLDCGGNIHRLGAPTWSHGSGILHAYDLEWTTPRVRASCRLFAKDSTGQIFASERNLFVRPQGSPGSITKVTPEGMNAEDEAVVEIMGHGFSNTISVIWVSAHQFQSYERSARTQGSDDEQEAIVSFAAGLRKAPVGQYLVVVENEDRLAVIYDGYYVVEDDPEADIETVAVQRRDGTLFLTLRGFELEGIDNAAVDFPAGRIPARLVRHEGTLVETLSLELPYMSDNDLAQLPRFELNGGTLTVVVRDVDRVMAPASDR